MGSTTCTGQPDIFGNSFVLNIKSVRYRIRINCLCEQWVYIINMCLYIFRYFILFAIAAIFAKYTAYSHL